MLSLFPFALSFGLFAPTLLRITLSALLIIAAWRDLTASEARMRMLGIAETLAAALLFVGLWTQAAALLSIIISGIWFFFPTRTYPISTILMVFVASLSLVVLGAGRFAIDLPF